MRLRIMHKNFCEPDILCKVYYDTGKKLSTRLNLWNNYGTNKTTLMDYLKSILMHKYNVYADLGCGNAYNSLSLLSSVQQKSYMCDVSSNILDEARLNISRFTSENNVVFLNEDIKQTSIESNSCDLITLMHVLHHIDDINAVFKEVNRIAAPGATLIITTYDHTLKDFLNVKHYDNLSELGFPEYMKDKEDYLKFNGENAFNITRNYFGENNVICHKYENHAKISDAEKVMEYYTSAMMYRLSQGIYSNDISQQKWSQLEVSMRNSVETELQNKGHILIEGFVTILEVKL